MLQRTQTNPNDMRPLDHQAVDVRIGNRDWQPATYEHGEFVDIYGMTLDRRRISAWRPVGGTVEHRV